MFSGEATDVEQKQSNIYFIDHQRPQLIFLGKHVQIGQASK